MAAMYTAGTWSVSEENAEAFVAAWTEFVQWTMGGFDGCTFAKLTRDQADPTRFFSFGPWRDADAVAAWQGHPEWSERLDAVRGLAESVTIHVLDVASEVGAVTPDP